MKTLIIIRHSKSSWKDHSLSDFDRPLNKRHNSIWCSQRDIAQLVEKCIEAPENLRYDIFYGVSNNKWSYRDINHARKVVGFVPHDSADL